MRGFSRRVDCDRGGCDRGGLNPVPTTPDAPGQYVVTPNLHNALVSLLPRLRRFGVSLTGSVNEAEELVQSACERVLGQARKLAGSARLDTSTYAIMRDLWNSERRDRVTRRYDGMEAAAQVIGDDGEKTVDGILTLAVVRRALTELPPDLRSVLVLICIDGLHYSDVAEVLGIPVGTVISRVTRGREELRRRLDGENVHELPARLRLTGSHPINK